MFQHSQLSFTKATSSLCSGFLCRGLLNRGQLNYDRFEFWLPTSQLLALDVCLSDAFS
ncbi:DUF645 family protein [Vibrio cholerae]|nr:DUF645 family protein [Vibrio cholerae]